MSADDVGQVADRSSVTAELIITNRDSLGAAELLVTTSTSHHTSKLENLAEYQRFSPPLFRLLNYEQSIRGSLEVVSHE